MMLCPLCRAFLRFESRATQREECSATERDALFTTACWIVAALERTHPCAAHPRTLGLASRLADELAALVEEGGTGINRATCTALTVTPRKEIRQ
jgi:hypothetical protein